MSAYADLIERLLSNEPLPMCPYHPLSPEYLTTPDDGPCRICGQENTTEGPDKCRGADTRCMKEAADAISRLEREKVEAVGMLTELCSDAEMGITHTTGIWKRVEAFLSHIQEQAA